MASKDFYMSPRARLSFSQQLFTPKSFNGNKAKYGCTLLFDDAAMATKEWKAMMDAANAAVSEKWGGKKVSLRSPVLSGDDDKYSHYAGYPGMKFIRVSTEFKPGFVARDGSEIAFDEAEDQLYSGCFVRATLNVFAYDTQGNKGVSFGLRNLQKLADGESLGGSRDPTGDFGAVEDDGADLDEQFASNLIG